MICGLGVIVVIFCFVMEYMGKIDYLFYDGLWFEWGMYVDFLILIGDN